MELREALRRTLPIKDSPKMKTVYQTHVQHSASSTYLDDDIAKRFAAADGLVMDLERVLRCIDRILEAHEKDERDEISLQAYTWQLVILYARCWESASEGRRGRISDKALRGLTGDERTLHDGLLDIRDRRFAHAGDDAEHRCIVTLVDDAGALSLHCASEIEAPGGMFDPDQAELALSLVGKVRAFAVERAQEALERLDEYVNHPDRREALIAELEAKRGKYATPEQQALAMLRRLKQPP